MGKKKPKHNLYFQTLKAARKTYDSHNSLGFPLVLSCVSNSIYKKKHIRKTRLKTPLSSEGILTPCTPLPVLLSHCQKLFDSIIHCFGESTHCITFLFSIVFGKKRKTKSSLNRCVTLTLNTILKYLGASAML